ncbi:MAG TPA: exodeoxyribonuclease VII large subunit, partial [Candidatus Limnocylindria bacterium]|nr:exodeoxyribonuclease VII large subunit [Candidatus Limnocylindria bacterium]
VATARQRAADLLDRGHRALSARAQRERGSLAALGDALRTLSPAATLERGYAIARLPDGTIVRDPQQAGPGARLTVSVARGRLQTRVEEAMPGAPLEGTAP